MCNTCSKVTKHIESVHHSPSHFSHSEAIVSQVLDELGVEVGDKVSIYVTDFFTVIVTSLLLNV